MTLQAGLIYRRAVHLWSDTAAFDPSTGEFVGHVRKATLGENWPWAAAYTGALPAEGLEACERVVKAAAPTNCTDLVRAWQTALRLQAAAGFPGRVLLGYPCETAGARMCLIASDDLPFAAAYEPYELDEFRSGGEGTAWAAKFDRKPMTPKRMDKFIDHLAKDPGESLQGWPNRVGGRVLEFRVTAAAVEMGFLDLEQSVSGIPIG